MMHPQPKLAVSYVRVSTRDQADNYSRDAQGQHIENYLRKENLLVSRPFDDVGSGLSVRERPEFVAAVEFACDPANEITDFVVDDLSRFTRSVRDLYPYVDRLEERRAHGPLRS